MGLRRIVVMYLPNKEADEFARAKEIRNKLENNPRVTTLAVSIKDLDADIAAWDTALGKKGPGTAQARKAARQKVRNDLAAERGSVQWVVDTVATLADAAAVAESAGMSLAKLTARPRLIFAAYATSTPGTVRVTAPRSKKGEPHEWQHASDGQTWISTPSTLKATTLIAGLTVGAPWSFRHRLVTKDGPSEWSDPVMVIVK